MKEVKNPEATGLVLNLIARYAAGKSENEFDKAVATALGNDATVKQSVRQIIDAMQKKPEVMKVLSKEVAADPIQVFSADKYKAVFGKLKPPVQIDRPEIDEPVTNNKAKENVSSANVNIRLFYRGLKCLEETSEASASDEPYLITSVVDSNQNVKTVLNPFGQTSYTDVDAGEKRVGPEIALYTGKARDLTLISTMMEHDQGDPKAYRGYIDAVVKGSAAALATATGIAIPQIIQDILTDIINVLFGTDDDLIETDSRFLDKSQLIIWSKAALKTKEKENMFGQEVNMPAPMGYHFRTWHIGDGGRYRAYYRVREGEN